MDIQSIVVAMVMDFILVGVQSLHIPQLVSCHLLLTILAAGKLAEAVC